MNNEFINVYARDNGALLTSFPGGAQAPAGYEIAHYEENGHDIYQEWLDNLRDMRGRTAIIRAVKRAENGNFGVHHFCRDGVWELVIDFGPGYRVYYSIVGSAIVLLLCAGQKRGQNRDIEKAIEYLKRYKEVCGHDNIHHQQ